MFNLPNKTGRVASREVAKIRSELKCDLKVYFHILQKFQMFD